MKDFCCKPVPSNCYVALNNVIRASQCGWLSRIPQDFFSATKEPTTEQIVGFLHLK